MSNLKTRAGKLWLCVDVLIIVGLAAAVVNLYSNAVTFQGLKVRAPYMEERAELLQRIHELEIQVLKLETQIKEHHPQ